MPSSSAIFRAAASLRDPTATILQSGLFIMLGTTLVRPILAVLRMPHRTGSMQFSLAFSRVFACWTGHAPSSRAPVQRPPNRSADNKGTSTDFSRRLWQPCAVDPRLTAGMVCANAEQPLRDGELLRC
jgi:hypothetical protein